MFLGTSKNGTEMLVNEMAVNADRLVIITSVEPHSCGLHRRASPSFRGGRSQDHRAEHKLAMNRGPGAGSRGQPCARGHDGCSEGRK